MAVKLRLARFGQHKRPFYRIIATESQSRRDGRFIEIVGTLNPMTEPPIVEIKEDRATWWIEHGAKPTGRVAGILKEKIPGLLEKRGDNATNKIQESRRARKKRYGGRDPQRVARLAKKEERKKQKSASA